MKQKKINLNIEWSGREGFTFWNDWFEVNWVVISLDDKLLARKTVINDKNYETVYLYEVPRDCADEVKALYDEVILDFVDVCFDDFGLECGVQPFCDFAGPEDYDLIELLDEFGVDYNTFLRDVFFQYRVMVEAEEMLGDDYYCEHESSMTEDERLAKKVIDRLGNLEASIEFADDVIVYWEFAEARGDLWFRRADVQFDGPLMAIEDNYGHVNLDDEDGVSVLRDALLADLSADEVVAYDLDDKIMELLYFCEADFEFDDWCLQLNKVGAPPALLRCRGIFYA